MFHLPSAIQLNAVAGKYEHQENQQRRYQQDLLEASAQLIDHLSHVRHECEYSQWSNAP